MKTSRLALSIAAGLSLLAGLGNAAEPGISDTEILIGEILPLSGPGSFAGEAHYLGTKIALAQANEAGGVAGRKVVAITEDDGYVPARAFQAAQKLLNVDNVFAITGTSGTSHLLGMMPLLIEKNVLTMVSINTSEAAYEPVKRNIFAVGTSYNHVVYRMMRYAIEELDKKDGRFGIIYQEDDFGANVKAGYERAIKDFGLTNAVEIPYKRGQKDFSAEMLRVASEDIDFLVSGGIVSENVAVMKESRKLGLDKLDIGTVWTAHLPIVQQLAGDAGNGYFAADYVAAVNEPEAAPFMDLAKKYLSEEELKKVNRYSMTSYTGAAVLVQAMRKCEADLTRDCVIGKLESGEPFDVGTIIEPLTFTPDRHFSNSMPRVLKSDPANGGFTRVTKD